MRIKVKSKRHCKRFDAEGHYGIIGDWWLELAGKVLEVNRNSRRNVHQITRVFRQKDINGISGLALPNNCIAKRFKD